MSISVLDESASDYVEPSNPLSDINQASQYKGPALPLSGGKLILQADQDYHIKKACELSKLTMDSLSEESKNEIKHLFAQMGKAIAKYNLNAEDIEYLLLAAPDARCRMIPKWTEERERRLEFIKEFIEASLNASRDIFSPEFDENIESWSIDIETICTSLGYCAIAPNSAELGPPWIRKGSPAPESLKIMVKEIDKGQFLVPAIGDQAKESHAFPSRYQEFVKLDEASKDVKTHAKIRCDIEAPEDLSTIICGACEQPAVAKGDFLSKEGLKSSAFTKDSYVMRGLQSGVHMRSHVSGSAPLTLAAMDFLDAIDSPKASERQIQLRGGLLVAIYQLGDYHSLAETAAGVSHYYQMRHIKDGKEAVFVSDQVHYLQQLSPANFLALALGQMLSVISDETIESFQKLQQNLLEKVHSRVSSRRKNIDRG